MRKKLFILSLALAVIFSGFSLPVNVKAATSSDYTFSFGFTPYYTLLDPSRAVVYASVQSEKKVYAINYETKSMTSIQFEYTPERLYIQNGELFVTLSQYHNDYSVQPGAVAVIDTATFTLKEQFNIDTDPFDISVDSNGIIYISGGSGQWTNLASYSRTTKTRIGSTLIREQSYIAMQPTLNKVYSITTEASPISMSVYNISNGSFPGSSYSPPSVGSYVGLTSNMKISPDGKYIFNSSGKIYGCASDQANDLKYVASLDSSYSDIAFDIPNNRFYTATGDLIKVYDYTTFKFVESYQSSGKIDFLNYQNGKLIALGNSEYNKGITQVISKDSIDGKPMAGTIAVDNATNTGDYELSINIRPFSNATSYKVYDGTTVEYSGTVTSAGLSRAIPITGKPEGTYSYKLETINDIGTVSSNSITVNVTAFSNFGVSYSAHVQNVGWQVPVQDGGLSGFDGSGLRLEAIKINLVNAPTGVNVKYQAHVQNIGWQNWVQNGAMAGTQGLSYRVEAMKIQLENAPGYSIQYQAYVQGIGWQNWVQDGQMCGTSGQSLRIEALRVKIVNHSTKPSVQYQGHVQNIGWQSWVNEGQVCGTTGQNLRVEAFKLNLVNAPANAKIIYQTHVQNIGWQNWVENGAIAGTQGLAYRVEAIKIKLANMPGYSVQYQGYIQGIGWQDWVQDGQVCGTSGQSLRIEAVRIKIVKEQAMPSIEYQAHVQNIGWQNWAQEGDLAGTVGQSLRVEALRIRLVNAPAGAKIRYQAHVQNIGWQDFTENGQIAGTSGMGYRVEAIRIILENAPGYSVQYQTHVQGIGWQDWVHDGLAAGTEGQSLRIEALRIRIVKTGNTMWNVVNWGQAVQSKGWIYYSDPSLNGALCKAKVDGTEKATLATDNVNFINVVNDWVYFSNATDGEKPYKIKIDGTSKTKLNDLAVECVRVLGDKLFYYSPDDSEIYKMNLDGTNNVSASIPTYDYMVMSSEDIYVLDSDSGTVYSYSLSKDSGFNLLYGYSDSFVEANGWVYYTNKNDNNTLYKVRTDGTGNIKLTTVACSFVSVIGDWIYFDNSDDNDNLYRVKTDGSYLERFGVY